MKKEHETDIHWYKKTYKYLTEDKGWSVADVAADVDLTVLTVQKFVRISKQELEGMKIRASTLAKMQDWIKKWKAEVMAVDCSEAEFREAMDILVEENGKSGNVDAPEIQPMTLGEADVWDLLRTLSKREEVRLNIQISMN